MTWQGPDTGRYDEFVVELTGVADTQRVVSGNSDPFQASFSLLLSGTLYTVEVVTVSGDQSSTTVTKDFYTSKILEDFYAVYFFFSSLESTSYSI